MSGRLPQSCHPWTDDEFMVPARTPASPAITAAQAPALLTTAQRALADGVTPKCIRERIKAGSLPGWKIGDRWLTVEPRP